MSLPVAARGEKEYLSAAWSARDFDFELGCRVYGRNDAFWVLCYRAHLDGDPLPDEKLARKFVRAANRATGGLNQSGERERYTLYEANATIEQVRRYRGAGLKTLVAKRRSARKITPGASRLLDAACSVAEKSKRSTFACSHRRLAAMAGVHPCQVSGYLYELERKEQIFRRGFTPAVPGRKRGTTILSLKPPRPMQRIDELEPPTWDARKAQWSWSTPLARGTTTYSRWRWLARRQSSAAASVPNVNEFSSRSSKTTTSIVFSSFDNPLRGSP